MDYHYSFNSYSEAVTAVTSRPAFPRNVPRWEREVAGDFTALEGGEGSWFGWLGVNKKPIAKLAHFFLVEGWEYGVKKMRDTLQQVKAPVVMSVRRRQVWGSDGSEISRDKLYAGQIDTMYRTTRKQMVTSPTRVRVVFDACVHGGVHAEDMFWAGAAGTVLTEALVEAGYSVELVSTAKSGELKDTFQMDTVFKAFDQPFNLATTLAITAHASFFRQVWFTGQSALMPRAEFLGKGSIRRVSVADFETPGVKTLLVTPMQSAREANAWVTQSLKTLEGVN